MYSSMEIYKNIIDRIRTSSLHLFLFLRINADRRFYHAYVIARPRFELGSRAPKVRLQN